MLNYIGGKTLYPYKAICKKMEGTVLVQFRVMPDGSISKVKVIKKLDSSLDKLAKQIIKEMPPWSPAMENGVAVESEVTLPVVFSLKYVLSSYASFDAKDPVFLITPKLPEYPGGQDALMSYLHSAIRYPDSPLLKGIQGRVILRFVVRKDGRLSDFEVARGVDPEIDQEALRVVRLMPKWIPAEYYGGRKVSMHFNLPIYFKITK